MGRVLGPQTGSVSAVFLRVLEALLGWAGPVPRQALFGLVFLGFLGALFGLGRPRSPRRLCFGSYSLDLSAKCTGKLRLGCLFCDGPPPFSNRFCLGLCSLRLWAKGVRRRLRTFLCWAGPRPPNSLRLVLSYSFALDRPQAPNKACVHWVCGSLFGPALVPWRTLFRPVFLGFEGRSHVDTPLGFFFGSGPGPRQALLGLACWCADCFEHAF